jgi:signal transduction histidine kinase
MTQVTGRRREPALARDLEALDEVALNALGFEQMMEGIVAAVAPVLDAATCGVMTWEPVHDALQLLPASFGVNEATAASYRVSSTDVRSNAARVFSTGVPFVSNCAAGDSAILQDYVEVLGVERLLTVPLALGDRRTGVLHFANPGAPFEPDDLAIARQVAPRVAVAVEHVRNRVRMRRREGLEGILGRAAKGIASGSPLDEIIASAVDELRLISRARCVLLSVAGADPVVRGSPEGEDGGGASQFLQDSRSAPRTIQERLARPHHAGDPGWAALHVPVVVSDEYVGTLSLLRTGAEPLSRDERTAIRRLADLIALAWATERYQQERAAMARLRERELIAEDLHDHVAQVLFATKTELEAALEQPSLEGAPRKSVARARELLARGEESMRDVIEALSRAGQPDGVIERLERVVQEVEEQFGIAVHLELPRTRLPLGPGSQAVADLLVRACREALVNAAKHAGPTRVGVGLRPTRDGRVLLTVQDDGIGPPTGGRRNGHGLKALRRAVRERGGALRVSRGSLGGTKLTMSIDWRF